MLRVIRIVQTIVGRRQLKVSFVTTTCVGPGWRPTRDSACSFTTVGSGNTDGREVDRWCRLALLISGLHLDGTAVLRSSRASPRTTLATTECNCHHHRTVGFRVYSVFLITVNNIYICYVGCGLE